MPATKEQRRAIKGLLKELDEYQWDAIIGIIDAFTIADCDSDDVNFDENKDEKPGRRTRQFVLTQTDRKDPP